MHVPDEWLRHVVRGLRNKIDVGVALCIEVDEQYQLNICPIEADDAPDIDGYHRTHGVSGCVNHLVSLFNRLVEVDLLSAKKEFDAWRSDDESVFARLRLWASGKQKLTTPDEAAEVVQGLSDNVFWGESHQRDLLVLLRARWSDLSNDHRK